MKNTLFILIISFFLFSLKCTAQMSNQGMDATLIRCDTIDNYLDMLFNPDGTYYMVGADSMLVNANANAWDGVISKFAADHSLLWRKRIGGSKMDWLFNIEPYLDGKLIVAGHTSSSDGDVSYGYPFTAQDAWLIVIDSNGNQLHGTTWGYGNATELSGVNVTSDGKIFVSGVTIANAGDFIINTGSFLVDVSYVALVDSQLNKKWLKLFIDNNADIQTPGGFCIQNDTLVLPFLTFSNSGDFNYGTPLGGVDVRIFYIDTNQIIHRKIRKGGSGNESIAALERDGNDIIGWVVTDSMNGDFFTNEIPGTSVTTTWYSLFKMDGSGNILWKHLFGDFGANRSTNVTLDLQHMKMTNDQICIAGTTNGYDDGWIGHSFGLDTIGATTDIFVTQFNKSGLLERKLRIGNGGDEFFQFIQYDALGNIYIGFKTFYNTLFPLNPMSCHSNGKGNSFNLYKLTPYPLATPNTNSQVEQLVVYPNPGKEYINISFSGKNYSFQVYNNQGQLMDKIKNVKSNTTTLQVGNYLPGMYHIQLQYHKKVYNASFIIQ